MGKELLTTEQTEAMVEQLAEDAVSLVNYTKDDHDRIMSIVREIHNNQPPDRAGGLSIYEINYQYIKNLLQKGAA